ncbi:MAG: KH domain-containing protein [Oligosphaeraceae bacterium]|nr:KH domain-containing protein [Oligosphaeraceae bacterium]
MMDANELRDKAVAVLSEMVEHLGLQAKVTADLIDGERLKLCLESRESGRLIGRKGQNLESLELLLNRIMKRNDENNPWIPVEVDGYSTGRTGGEGPRHRGERVDKERFQCLATEAAKEVKRWQQEKKLGPFSPAERRVIHITLEQDEQICTESEPIPGDTGRKFVIVKLKS